MAPLLSICIPTYERLGYLKECVQSARDQTWSNIEIIIGNDGTNEKLADWASKIARTDPRIRYQKNRDRLGLAGNWNAVARASRGKYLVIVGDDDRLLPTFAERLMSAGDGADVLFSNHHVIDADGARLAGEGERYSRMYGRDLLPEGLLPAPPVAVWRNAIPMSSSLILTSQVQSLGFKEDINTPEIELFARLVRDGGRFFFSREYLCEYRSHGGSATAAGLSTERLAAYLTEIAAPPEAEREKRKFIGAALVHIAAAKLESGDVDGARRAVQNAYYPVRTGVRPGLLRIATMVPLSAFAYPAAARLLRVARNLGRLLR